MMGGDLLSIKQQEVVIYVVITGSIKQAVSTYKALNIQRLVQVAAVLLQWFCCRVPQRRAHQETEEPHNDYRLLLQGSVVTAYPENWYRK